MVKQSLVAVAPPRAASSALPSASATYRNSSAASGMTTPAFDSLYHMFRASVSKFPQNKCLGYRPTINGVSGDYAWLTYSEVGDRSEKIASAMKKAANLAKGDRVGVYGPNCPQWMIAMQACNRMGYPCVPLYDTLGANAIEYIMNHADVKAAVVAADKLKVFLSAKSNNLKVVVYWGEAKDIPAAPAGVTLYSWDDFMQLGSANPVDADPPSGTDLCTVMYTSGTTGDPKGVMIKHESVLVTTAAVEQNMKDVWEPMTSEDCFLSYLPLAHIFDRVVEEMFLGMGGSIGYWRGDIKLMLEDIAALRPTMFIGVPRVFERIYSRAMEKVNASFVKKFLFNWATSTKLKALNSGKSAAAATPLFDKIVFATSKKALGGRVRVIISGAAPLSRHIEDFLRCAMCCPVVQGYGLTESTAASFIAPPDQSEYVGSVGMPMTTIELKVESVPDMNYDACPASGNPKGEVCIRGTPLFQGYFKQEEMTAEVVDADGFFHTGDVGEIDLKNNTLKIIDRKKNIFKLSQGEYVAVEKVEEIFSKTPGIDMLWVYGNSFEATLVCVVVPNEDALMSWAKGKLSGDFKTVCASDEARKYVLGNMTAAGKEGKLKGFEMVKHVLLEPVPFDMDRDMLTPTFKKKRPQLLKYYQKEIDAMYVELKKKEAARNQA
ncbi:long chain acyl-CoA synthetase [Pycnococcus provasolii]